jgi:Spy/CpxP family protein refolding chaperone
MLRKKAWVGLLFLVVFLPTTIFAQGMMHGKWWHDKSIVQNLELTDSEKKELDEAYIESRRKMIDLKGEIEKQRFELDLLLGSKDADKPEIMAGFASLEQARAQLSRIRFEMLLEIRDIIGAERFQDLEIMHRDRGRKDTKRFSQDRSYPQESDKE